MPTTTRRSSCVSSRLSWPCKWAGQVQLESNLQRRRALERTHPITVQPDPDDDDRVLHTHINVHVRRRRRHFLVIPSVPRSLPNLTTLLTSIQLSHTTTNTTARDSVGWPIFRHVPPDAKLFFISNSDAHEQHVSASASVRGTHPQLPHLRFHVETDEQPR